jgi:hypothetical protein
MDRQEKLCSKAGASSVIAAYALQYGRISDSESPEEKRKDSGSIRGTWKRNGIEY